MGSLLISRATYDAVSPAMQPLLQAHGATASGFRIALLEDCIENPARVPANIELAFLSSDLLGTSSDPKCNPAFAEFVRLVQEAPPLRWLQLASAGADGAVYRALMKKGVQVTTASGANALAVAHTALAALLAFAREVPLWVEAKSARRWSPLWADPPRDLEGTRAVVVGLGPVGREISRLCRAFGLHVTGVRRQAEPLPECDEVRSLAELPQLLGRADWLILACPLTDETRGLFDRELLASLPPQARLINVARGGIVDEDALCAALVAGKLAGAYSDVFAQEPLPSDSSLWDAPHLLLSSHSAGAAQGVQARANAVFLTNLERWLAGAPLLNDRCPFVAAAPSPAGRWCCAAAGPAAASA